MSKTRKFKENELLVVDIMQTAHFLENKLGDVFKEYGLTNVQYNILRILRGASPDLLGVGEIKSRIRFKNSDMSRLLDRLVSKDYVNRDICKENRRKMDVCISKNGLEVLDVLDEKIEKKLNEFYSKVVTSKKAMEFSEILKSIREQ